MYMIAFLLKVGNTVFLCKMKWNFLQYCMDVLCGIYNYSYMAVPKQKKQTKKHNSSNKCGKLRME